MPSHTQDDGFASVSAIFHRKNDAIRNGMRFSTIFPLFIPRLNAGPVGNANSDVVAGWKSVHSDFVSAMELALMGGWPTKDGRAGSAAFEFIWKGSGRKPGAAEAIFFARNLTCAFASTGSVLRWPLQGY